MIEILEWENLSKDQRTAALARAPSTGSAELYDSVRAILTRVKAEGDGAVREYTSRFDGCDAPIAFVPETKLKEALASIAPDLRRALDMAVQNVTAFHAAQKPMSVRVETMPGVVCEMQWRAVEKVGLYVPGGLAPLFSTVLMLAIPARLAGCREIILTTPPAKDGTINQGILAAACLCGVTKVVPVGGAQAIAALAYGTATIPKTDKIFGPGNSYVTCAKQLVAQDTDGAAIDLPAGPSEVMVVAERGNNAAWVASDMLAQAEHGKDSQALCVVTDRALAEDVQKEVVRQAALLPRSAFIAESLKYSRILLVRDAKEAIDVANLYAPEHLILHGKDAAAQTALVQTAGAVFVGPYAPETAGDYASGGNHVLPTYGYARAYAGLSLQSFMRSMSVQTLTEKGLAAMGPSLVALARAEGLEAHAAAVTIRGVA